MFLAMIIQIFYHKGKFMKKKFFLILVIACISILGTSSVYASTCSYYQEKVVYYSDKSLSLMKIQPTNWCDVADALELMLNNAGSAKTNCSNGYEMNNIIQSYTPKTA